MIFFKMPKLTIGNRTVTLPIVQGGMGVGISLSGLASAVAEQGGIGVIAANGIGMIEPDYYQRRPGRQHPGPAQRDPRKARAKTSRTDRRQHHGGGQRFPAAAGRLAIEEKVDALFMGAGLPIKNIPVAKIRAAEVLVIPIVSSGRAAELIFKYWEKAYGDVPDAVVVEGPLAGGHLGFKAEKLQDADQQLEVLVPAGRRRRGPLCRRPSTRKSRSSPPEAFSPARTSCVSCSWARRACRWPRVSWPPTNATPIIRFKEAYVALPPRGHRHHQEPGRAAGAGHPQPFPGQRRRRRTQRQALRLALPGAVRHPACRLLHLGRAGQRPPGAARPGLRFLRRQCPPRGQDRPRGRSCWTA